MAEGISSVLELELDVWRSTKTSGGHFIINLELHMESNHYPEDINFRSYIKLGN